MRIAARIGGVRSSFSQALSACDPRARNARRVAPPRAPQGVARTSFSSRVTSRATASRAAATYLRGSTTSG
ncbi:hypothetical protein D3C57_137320 [Streptomyces rapamycinicus NRRL 5491]|uniref:Uncharacterized protein n=1 Tax=Streptomyces rapamycinicus (strain ATCC 29253 / DSM 41530 / NRRL 5491 / AYB-994) TaxID=1343740 RepID=A0A3L8R6J9_STRRN|nr:hypothetical protein D3C57_137320 [Streptomyces rapamycinicus NRRL 5491]